jgi:hypothetical protein
LDGIGWEFWNRLSFGYILYIAPVQIIAWLVRRGKKGTKKQPPIANDAGPE